MALTTNEIQVLWSAAASLSTGEGTNATSDEFSFTADTSWQAKVQLKAKNDGTPAAGDTVDFYLLESLGDPDGASTDEFATTTQGIHLARLDTNVTDPAGTTVHLPGPFHKGKIYVVNNSAGRDITVSALVFEQVSS